MLRVSFGKALILAKSQIVDWRICGTIDGLQCHSSVLSSFVRLTVSCGAAIVMTVAQLQAMRWIPLHINALASAALLPYYEQFYNAFWTAVRRRCLQNALKELNSRYTVVGQTPFLANRPQLVIVRAHRTAPPSVLSVSCMTAVA
eukprot:EG_transcript_39716